MLAFNSKSFVSCSFPTHFRDSVRNDLCVLKRRALVFTSPMTFLLPPTDFLGSLGVATAETGTSADLRIREEVRKVVSKGKAAGILRLVFHDGGTFDMDENSGGMNGSIVYELDRPENTGLKKSLKILEKAKSEVDAVEPASWADTIAVAGAEAVSICGGPNIPVGLGRLDSLKADPEGRLPLESLNASGLKQCFLKKGFSTRELVALSGAHTLGSKGFGNPTVFDNSYFQILLERPWKSSAGGMTTMIGLPSDRALVEDEECIRNTKWAGKRKEVRGIPITLKVLPSSPKLDQKKSSTIEDAEGSNFRLSLDKKGTQNSSAKGDVTTQLQKPLRKSLPRLPPERTTASNL